MISGKMGGLSAVAGTADANKAERAPESADVGRPLVLVIEDDRHDWEIYGKILWYNGYDVLYAAEGNEGYRLACAHRPDLVLLDVMIPNIDGIALCEQLKHETSTTDIPVVMLSGRAFSEIGSAATQAGCAAYLEKPIGPVEVLHKVEELIGRAPRPGEGRPPRVLPTD